MPDNDESWAQLVKHLPLAVRSQIAAARNTQKRVTALREQMTEEGLKLRTQVKRINGAYGVNPNLLSKCLGVSRNRVLEMLAKK